MAQTHEILAGFKNLFGTSPIQVLLATVKSVEGNACTVTTTEGLELPDVRLKASVNDSKEYFVTKPRVGSSVLISLIGNDQFAAEYVVIAQDEFDSIEAVVDKTAIVIKKESVSVEKGKMQFLIDDEKFNVINDNTGIFVKTDKIEIVANGKLSITGGSYGAHSLKEILNGLCDAIINIKTVGTGSAVADPSTITTVQFIKQTLSQIM